MIGMAIYGLGFAVLCVVIILAALELVLRFRRIVEERFLYRSVERKEFLAKPYHPYLEWIEDWSKPMFRYVPIGFRIFNNSNQLAPVTNNSLGFRCGEFEPPQKDELRLVVLGGSAAWGFGASGNGATFGSQLELLINEDKRLLTGGKKFARCFNLAQVDATQTQDMLNIISFFSVLQPTIVVSLTGWNELASNMRMDEGLLNDWGFYLAEMEGWEPIKAGNNARSQMTQAALQWGSRHSDFVRLVSERFFPSVGFRRNIPDAIAVGVPLFLRNLENIVRLGLAYRYRHFQFLQPNLYRKLHLVPAEAKVLQLYDVYRPIHGGREAGDFFRETDIYADVTRAAENAPERFGVVRNLESIFREEREWMQYSLVHCTDEGYRRIAETIYEILVENQIN